MLNINFANDWIRAENLWYWKQPLYQLSHNRCPKITFSFFRLAADSWRSWVEGDEQPDRPNSQTCMEWCHAWAVLYFGLFINTTAYHLVRYSLHLLLLLKSFMVTGFKPAAFRYFQILRPMRGSELRDSMSNALYVKNGINPAISYTQVHYLKGYFLLRYTSNGT